MKYKFEHGFILMIHGGFSFIGQSSRNGRPIYCPAGLNYQSSTVCRFIPGVIGFKDLRLPKAEWDHTQFRWTHNMLANLYLIHDGGNESIEKYFTKQPGYQGRVSKLAVKYSPFLVENIHAIAINMSNR